MPYIDKQLRQDARLYPENIGELVFALTGVCDRYFANVDPHFSEYAEVIAALECTKLEFYRRIIAPYEDKKCAANGDVYEFSKV